jgi:hypothetical protein
VSKTQQPPQGRPSRARYTEIQVQRQSDGFWHATQEGVDLTGRGPNPGRAVADYGEQVAETVYEADAENPTND